MNRTKRICAFFIAAIMLCALMPLCVGFGAEGSSGAVPDVSDFEGKRIGNVTGAWFDTLLNEKFSSVKIEYFNGTPDMVMALKDGKLDAFVADRPVAEQIVRSEASLTLAKGVVAPDDYGFIFPKNETGERLQTQFNEYFRKISENGELEAIKKKRFDEADASPVDLPKSGENGVISFATTSLYPPFSFISEGQATGFDLDIVEGFCKEYGYGVNLSDIDVSSVITGVAAGKYDMYASTTSITEERKQSVLFSDPVYNGGVVLVCQKTGAAAENGGSNNADSGRLEDFADKMIGVKEGTVYDTMTSEMFPNAKTSYYKNNPDLALALIEGKIDCFMANEPSGRVMCKEKPEMYIVGGSNIKDEEYAFAFGKDENGEKLRDEMNEFLAKAWADGTIKEFDSIWFGDDESVKVVDMSDLEAKNGTLNFALCSNQNPFCYMNDGNIVGYDVALAVEFCREYGYALNVSDMEFAAMIPGIAAGKYDFGASCITVTPERAGSVNFSDANYHGGVVLLAKRGEVAASETEDKSFFEKVAESFEKTFIREDRWKLILEGIGTTMMISVCAALSGTILGFGVCMLRRSKHKPLAVIAQVYIRLLQGTPIVVFLMIMFYVVFGKSSINPMWVAVIGFAMNFAAYCAEIMRTGIDAVDNGQIEAAKAIGFTPVQTFLQVVMPQAARHFLPVYKGELISLVKSTSVVGYIAVQDLTKVSDIIRSRTYEAFFPLIATAVIYFILAWLLTVIVNLIMKKTEPNKKKRTVKGVVMK